MYDIMIIGGGPAGLSCAIYAKRAGLSAVIIEKGFFGGQMTTTFTIENYPGIKTISGFDLAENMRSYANELGCEFFEADVTKITDRGSYKQVQTPQKTLQGKTIVLCMGAQRRELGVKGENQLTGMGVSYCATCDGGFFKNKVVAVVGGGNTALEDAIYLSKFASQVYLIHRRDQFRGSNHLAKLVKQNPVIKIYYDTVLQEIMGDHKVNAMQIENVKTQKIDTVAVDGVFVAVGTVPQTDIVKGLIQLNDAGYIEADETLVTNIPGIFAAGDIRQKELRQVITASSDGAVAAHMAGRFISENI